VIYPIFSVVAIVLSNLLGTEALSREGQLEGVPALALLDWWSGRSIWKAIAAAIGL